MGDDVVKSYLGHIRGCSIQRSSHGRQSHPRFPRGDRYIRLPMETYSVGVFLPCGRLYRKTMSRKGLSIKRLPYRRASCVKPPSFHILRGCHIGKILSKVSHMKTSSWR